MREAPATADQASGSRTPLRTWLAGLTIFLGGAALAVVLGGAGSGGSAKLEFYLLNATAGQVVPPVVHPLGGGLLLFVEFDKSSGMLTFHDAARGQLGSDLEFGQSVELRGPAAPGATGDLVDTLEPVYSSGDLIRSEGVTGPLSKAEAKALRKGLLYAEHILVDDTTHARGQLLPLKGVKLTAAP